MENVGNLWENRKSFPQSTPCDIHARKGTLLSSKYACGISLESLTTVHPALIVFIVFIVAEVIPKIHNTPTDRSSRVAGYS